MLRFLLVLLACLGLGSVATVAPAADPVRPSFDCAQARTAIERTVCADPALALEDRDIAALFAATRTSAWGKGPSNELSAQRAWLKDLQTCDGPEQRAKGERDLKGCLLMAYRQRSGDLAVAALFTNRAVALEVLRRVKPSMAGLYEAVALYADGGQAQRERIDALLQPYWQQLQTNKNMSYGKDIIADTIKRPGDIAGSDKNFGLFAYVVSAYLGGDDEVISHPFPCAALVRRPGLTFAVSPVFGSTLDNFTLRADCGDTLPPQPRFDALSQRIDTIDPGCEQGTIRFALYRESELTFTSASLGLAPPKLPRGASLQKAPAGLVSAAQAELADQYWRYGGMDKAQATLRAKAWIAYLLRYQPSCGE